jgi:hypothetical protein
MLRGTWTFAMERSAADTRRSAGVTVSTLNALQPTGAHEAFVAQAIKYARSCAQSSSPGFVSVTASFRGRPQYEAASGTIRESQTEAQVGDDA